MPGINSLLHTSPSGPFQKAVIQLSPCFPPDFTVHFSLYCYCPLQSFFASFSSPFSFFFSVSPVFVYLCTVCVYCHKGTFSDPYSCGDGHSEGPHGRTGLFPSSEFILGRRGYYQMVSFYLKTINKAQGYYLNIPKCSVGYSEVR